MIKKYSFDGDMIKTKEDYLFYLEADRQSLGRKGKKPPIFRDPVWRFHRLLRKAEYLRNRGSDIVTKIRYEFVMYRYRKKSFASGLDIPLNVLGPGSVCPHGGSIVINSRAKIGANCRIHICVNIGTNEDFGNGKVPEIGDNVYIGPGAKIFGPIVIADGIAIGANAVVNKSFTEPEISIAGIPAKKVSDRGSESLIRKGSEIAKAMLRNVKS